MASSVPSWSSFDDEFEVNLPRRRDTRFFVRVAGRELAATNGVAVVLHGVRKNDIDVVEVCVQSALQPRYILWALVA